MSKPGENSPKLPLEDWQAPETGQGPITYEVLAIGSAKCPALLILAALSTGTSAVTKFCKPSKRPKELTGVKPAMQHTEPRVPRLNVPAQLPAGSSP